MTKQQLREKRHSIYNRLNNMSQRCYNPKSSSYRHYGGRGITVCERWKGQGRIDRFIEDMGFPPNDKLTLDRIDVNGDYTPENCRWADRTTQTLNRTTYGKCAKSGEKYIYKIYQGNYSTYQVAHWRYGKRILVGYRRTIKEAVKLRDKYLQENNFDMGTAWIK